MSIDAPNSPEPVIGKSMDRVRQLQRDKQTQRLQQIKEGIINSPLGRLFDRHKVPLAATATSVAIAAGVALHNGEPAQSQVEPQPSPEQPEDIIEAVATPEFIAPFDTTTLLTKNPDFIESAKVLMKQEKKIVEAIVTDPYLKGDSASLKTYKTYQAAIDAEAEKHGSSLEFKLLAEAIVLIENGGGTEEESINGGVGLYQILDGAGRDTGIIRGEGKNIVDERKNPFKNIEAGQAYIRMLEKFVGGDKGFTAAAFFAGYGTIAELAGVHAQGTLPTVEQAAVDSSTRDKIKDYLKTISVQELLEDETVKAYIKKEKGKRPHLEQIGSYVARVVESMNYLRDNELTGTLIITAPKLQTPLVARTDGAVV